MQYRVKCYSQKGMETMKNEVGTLNSSNKKVGTAYPSANTGRSFSRQYARCSFGIISWTSDISFPVYDMSVLLCLSISIFVVLYYLLSLADLA